MTGTESKSLRFPVVTAGAEYLVMGLLMRRNILAYKAPPNNEGYDLICIHPDPRHVPDVGQQAQVRVQVKSRYATDCDRGFPVREASFDAFDFLVIAFLNIGYFNRSRKTSTGARETEFFTLPSEFARKHHKVSPTWQRVQLRGLDEEMVPYAGEAGFEQIAAMLGVPYPERPTLKPRRTKSV